MAQVNRAKPRNFNREHYNLVDFHGVSLHEWDHVQHTEGRVSEDQESRSGHRRIGYLALRYLLLTEAIARLRRQKIKLPRIFEKRL